MKAALSWKRRNVESLKSCSNLSDLLEILLKCNEPFLNERIKFICIGNYGLVVKFMPNLVQK